MPSLNWIGKDEVINYNPPYHTLEKKYTFNAKNSDNMIIKGDNLLALKSLLPKYEGKVKCIYIDPPYNTGNENWVYNDNVNSPQIKKWLGEVVAKDDLSRHDKWLCMMMPRLKLLHRLLSDDGVIFISIDDNEMANLKLLCDEIFGSGNFESFIWKKKGGAGNTEKIIGCLTEYVLCFFKQKKAGSFNYQKLDRTYKFEDEISPYNLESIEKTNLGEYERPTMLFAIIDPKTNCEFYPSKDKRWTLGKQGAEKALENNQLFFDYNKNKVFLIKRPDNYELSKNVYYNLLTDCGSLAVAKTEINSIFDNREIFSTPKPLALLTRILEIATDKNSIILDSFAGSGTTAHAVLELNKKDGGNRKFILVEMEDYAENITAERVKRVIKGYGKEPGNSATGGDFSFYELGERLLLENGNINESISSEKIKEYIYFSETKEKYEHKGSDFLGECNGVAYYFIYKKDEITTLDFEYLANLKKASSYVIYADVCVLSDETMMKYNITFKKIPRDIKKV